MSVHEVGVGVGVQRGDAGLGKRWPICSGNVSAGPWALVMIRVSVRRASPYCSPGDAVRAQECDWTEVLIGPPSLGHSLPPPPYDVGNPEPG